MRLESIRRGAAELGVLALCTAALVLMAWMLAPLADAQSPSDVIAITQAHGGDFAPCLLAIEARETGGTFSATAQNPSSGAWGPLQFLPSGGVWQVTPWANTPVQSTSVADQVDAATWALGHGFKTAWNPLPNGC